MKRKGFTLIELMAVITILAILSLIIIPIVDKNIKESKESMYNIQIDNIRMAGQNYFSDNPSLLPLNGNYTFVKLDILVENNYIGKDVNNPKTGKAFTEEIYVQILNRSGSYEYLVCPLETGCEDYQGDFDEDEDYYKIRDVNPGIICGDELEENYYINDVCYIKSVEDLVGFSNMVNSGFTFTNKKVMLMNNLDVLNPKSYVDPNVIVFGDVNSDGETTILLEELSNNLSNGFPVIGDNNNKFIGTFEGNGYKLSNIYINYSSKNYVGLFGYNAGIVRGLILENMEVNGKEYTGGIVGYNKGIVSSSRYAGKVNGNRYVGLASGYNNGDIKDIVVDGLVYGSSYDVGGLVGYSSSGTISGVFRSGSVSSAISHDNIRKSVGDSSSTILNIVSLSDIIVDKNGSISNPTNTNLNSKTGYTVDENGINNIIVYESIMDTYIGSDTDLDGYYFDYNEDGIIELYSITRRPLVITMSGLGNESSPYIINNYSELKQVAYDLNGHYRLNNDIDLGDELPLMLSSYNNKFKGNFDGDFHTISSLYLDGFDYIGLFGYNNGTIEELLISDFSVSGDNYIGSIFGYNIGVVKGVNVNSSNVTGYEYVGGLGGYNKGSISSVKINSDVEGYRYLGLVAGYNNNGSIEGLVEGNVIGTSYYVGGLLGYNNNGSLKGVYLDGSVVGVNDTDVNKALGKNDSGSFKLIALDSITVTRGSTLINNTSTSLNSLCGYTTDNSSISNIAMIDSVLDTFVGGDNNNDGYYYDYNEEGKVDIFSISKNPLIITMEGIGNSDNPYVINNYDDLKQATFDLSKHYLMNNDIDMNGKNPIVLGSYANKFTGVFDGNGYSISNMTLMGIEDVGLFGYNNGTIKGLKLNNVNVSGYEYVGVLAGYNKGSISSVKVNGDVNGYRYLGLVAGYNNNGSIEGLVEGNVIGTSYYVGGLLGYNNNGSLKGVYLDGSVVGVNDSDVNKALGKNDSGSFKLVALDSITVTRGNTLINNTSRNLNSLCGYTTDISGINNIAMVENVLDTFVGGDNNNDGYYYDYNSEGKIDVFSIRRNPLVVTMNGSGTSDDPYIIDDYEELKQASYNQSLYYSLNADIDLSDKNPIILGSTSNHFTGVFEGNGYTISNITLIGTNEVGLFGYNEGIIKGLKLDRLEVIGYYYLGLVSGYNTGSITSVKLNGNIYGTRYLGLVSGYSKIGNVEGIVSGNVVGTEYYIGGLVGYLYNGRLNGFYTDGNVSGKSDNTVNRSLGVKNDGTIKLVALDSIKVHSSLYTSTSVGSLTGFSTTSEGVNNISMADSVLDTFVGGDNNNDGYYYDYNSEGIIDVFSISRNPLVVTMNGSGTSDDPYIIDDYEELKQASYNQSLYYSLNADIDLSDKNPIILGSTSNHFTGVFEGNGYTISNITLIGTNEVGLFGYNEGIIEGLKLNNINVTGYMYVGLVSGYNKGSIITVKVDGNVYGYKYLGLVSGYSTIGNIEAVALGNIVGTNVYIGGVLGYLNSGKLNAAYISGNISGKSDNTVNKTLGCKNNGTIKLVALNNIKVNSSTSTSTNLNSYTGKTYSESDLFTSIPYEEIGLNLSSTDPLVNKYIWYFDDTTITFRKN